MAKITRRTPLVSVIMPAHNAQEFLAAAIRSILDQSFTDFELIMVNDGSKDATGQIARNFAEQDKRVKVISYARNKGESAAANIGFAKSRGQYLARMDADDIAHPDRLAKQVAFLNKHPEYIVVGSQAHIIDEFDKVIGQKLFPQSHSEIFQQYGILHPMLHPAIMVRRSLIPWQNKLWANEAEPNDDYYTLFHFLHAGKFANLPQKLMYYRMHSNNKSMQHIKKKFVNSLRIRQYAIQHLGYPIHASMILNTAAQAAIVLTMPEWMTVGTFFWLKKMKPFDQAFPVLAKIKHQAVVTLSSGVRWEFAIGAFIAGVLHTIFSRNNS
jgi:glycosyltransferase involved in cell wall biosynthesis